MDEWGTNSGSSCLIHVGCITTHLLAEGKGNKKKNSAGNMIHFREKFHFKSSKFYLLQENINTKNMSSDHTLN